MRAVKVLFLTLLSVLAASAHNLRFGKCPKPAVQANFDPTKVNTNDLFSYLCLTYKSISQHGMCTMLLNVLLGLLRV